MNALVVSHSVAEQPTRQPPESRQRPRFERISTSSKHREDCARTALTIGDRALGPHSIIANANAQVGATDPAK
jgi:hypothetical protein